MQREQQMSRPKGRNEFRMFEKEDACRCARNAVRGWILERVSQSQAEARSLAEYENHCYSTCTGFKEESKLICILKDHSLCFHTI